MNGPDFFESLVQVARLRFSLLWRQRLGWASLVAGILAALISLLFARVSYLKPQKIFWDFVLGASFVLQSLLMSYLASHAVADERNRRTLPLLIASGIPRGAWMLGQLLGLWLGVVALGFVWFVVAWVAGALGLGDPISLLPFESQWIVSMEMLVLAAAAALLSLFIRPVLAFTATLVLEAFLHSVGAIERIFTDPQTKRYIDDFGVRSVLKLSQFLPPLEWFDLRVLVGYRPYVSFGVMLELSLLAGLWFLLLSLAALRRFDRMDL
ncbi:MAG: ABC transporter permease subunit [Bdellovibrionales bacterium]|nr:ABC transporter permease subunit [Bdellovibrionales bacterium]